MTISYVAAGAHARSFSGAVIPLPAGVVEGDFLLVHLEVQAATSTFTPPAGWSSTAGINYDAGDHAYWVWKIAGASEGDFAVGNASENAGGFMEAYRGVDPASPFDVAPRSEDAGSGTASKTPLTHPTITTVTPGAMAVQGVMASGDGPTADGMTIDGSSQGFTIGADGASYATAFGSDWSHGSAHRVMSSPGAATLPSWALGEVAQWAFMSLALAPASATPAGFRGWGIPMGGS